MFYLIVFIITPKKQTLKFMCIYISGYSWICLNLAVINVSPFWIRNCSLKSNRREFWDSSRIGSVRNLIPYWDNRFSGRTDLYDLASLELWDLLKLVEAMDGELWFIWFVTVLSIVVASHSHTWSSWQAVLCLFWEQLVLAGVNNKDPDLQRWTFFVLTASFTQIYESCCCGAFLLQLSRNWKD